MNQSDRILLSNLPPEDFKGSKSLPTPSPSSLVNSILPTSQESQSPSIGPNNPSQVSIVIHSNRIQPEQAEVASPIVTLRKLKLFPIFGDENIAKLSVNYFLYLEFFHICIKIFCILLVFTGIVFGLMTLGSDVIQRSQDTIMEYYGIFAFLIVIVLKLLLMREEKRLLDHYIMHEFQWTEDLFSLLVQGLPRNTDLQEIRDYFNGIVAPEGRVKDVIILQDSHEYAQIKKDIELIQAKLDKLDRNRNRKENDKEKRVKENKKLSEELRLKNDLLYKMERELIETRHFKGKAIVVFNTIEAKSIVTKYLKIPICLKPLLYLCCCCCCCVFDQYRFKGNIISVHEISEPEDVIFPNLHAPKRRFTRTLTAFFSSFTIIFLTLGLLLYLKGIELSEEVGEKSSLVLANSFASYTFTVAVIILGFVLDRGYRYVNGFFTYQSTLKANVNILNYGIFTSFILYILVQAVPASAGYSIWLEQLIRIFLFYFAKLLLLQLFAFCATSKTVKKARNSLTSPLLSKVTTRLHTKYIEFDFIRGITRAVPLLLIPLTFLLLNPIILLGMSIVALYICAIIDKYRMLRRCNIFKMKSSSYMIKAFRVFRWDIPCVAWGSLLVVQSRIIELYPRNLYDYDGRILDSPFFWGTNLCMVGLIVVYIIFTRPLSSKFKEKFFEKNAKVQYDTVCKEFTAHYRDKDPVRQIKKLTYFDKSELASRKRLLS